MEERGKKEREREREKKSERVKEKERERERKKEEDREALCYILEPLSVRLLRSRTNPVNTRRRKKIHLKRKEKKTKVG